LSIRIFYDATDYRVRGWRKTVKLIREIITKEKKKEGELNFIITNDDFVRKLNLQFLRHDYNTDIITFDYSRGNILSGEIYISIDTVQNNSINYNVSLKDEITRVIIHGVLHLTGYGDSTEKEKEIMRRREDHWLKIYNEKNYGIQI
jgi:probable rRNA maturation factor